MSIRTLATALVGLLHGLDDTDSDRLPHVTDGEATKRGVLSERLDAHGLRGNELDDGGITRLDKLGRLLDRFTRSTIDLLQKLRELARDMRSMAIEHGRIASANLTGVVKDNDLGIERGSLFGRVVLRVRGNVTAADFLDRDVPVTGSDDRRSGRARNSLDVEADVVTRETLNELFVVHFDGLDFGGDV